MKLNKPNFSAIIEDTYAFLRESTIVSKKYWNDFLTSKILCFEIT